MNKTEFRATISLAAVFAARLLGLFMIYPIFMHYARGLSGANARTIGLALGAYGLTQGLLQIPLGLLSDHIGRKKVIVGGLVVFGLGSVVAALSTSIGGVLLGRILQGAGAVGSSILAMVADLTREETRTRAMAVVGITIGFSFAIAVLVGPPLAAVAGLSGMFWLTAVFALVGIAIMLLLAPTPDHAVPRGVNWPTFQQVLHDGELLRLDFAVFTLHAILTASFLVIPSVLDHALRLNVGSEWKFYLPVMIVAMALMVPAIIVAETRGRMKEVFVAAVAAITASLVALAAAPSSGAAAVIALTVFFTAFNAMEAMLPSLVTKFAPASAKGAATGVYSSAQFIGIFVGGAAGGWMLATTGAFGVFAMTIALALIWLAVAAGMRGPAPRQKSRTGAVQAGVEKA
ncbi:MFS transporter [Rhodoblastus acidophilus]|uniref:MFS transporter n=1 Tax=Candidatus Rhodoblastus alkanivorans TaxID=2954117 RepID=A0ABS9Z6U9_9HYPH|nr:MFS transporter [Candidatus Rhodoblastus alkanivorans]MCI4680144.1 MFS transporter [Candidatus Rhodoblastus alkanivorans]MCI4683398.1 MFS transporter [Candidatus Rhodoblastus alkanivorans]MDI4640708.1 MFS transporter [Rhodoblastus acidophilus]